MAELVDALDSKSSSLGSVGSIPTRGTLRIRNYMFNIMLRIFFIYIFQKIAQIKFFSMRFYLMLIFQLKFC